MLFDNNLYFSEYSFLRAGGDSFGAYPLVRDQAAPPFYAPWFGLTTDFGYFRRWTFAVGAYGPSSVGVRSFGAFSATESGSVRPTPSRPKRRRHHPGARTSRRTRRSCSSGTLPMSARCDPRWTPLVAPTR